MVTAGGVLTWRLPSKARTVEAADCTRWYVVPAAKATGNLLCHGC
jgi:hypothetical protein